MLFGTQRINSAGHLEIGGCDTVALAEEFGTPLYVLDEAHLRERCREYLRAFRARLPEVEIAYAGKALLVKALCRIVEQEGLSLDVASAGELYTALQAGFPPERIKLHGNFKSDQELLMALRAPVGRVVADSLSEIVRLSRFAEAEGRQADLLIRVAPGIKTQTHTFIPDRAVGQQVRAAPLHQRRPGGGQIGAGLPRTAPAGIARAHRLATVRPGLLPEGGGTDGRVHGAGP